VAIKTARTGPGSVSSRLVMKSRTTERFVQSGAGSHLSVPIHTQYEFFVSENELG
jgi:hypothetical protein